MFIVTMKACMTTFYDKTQRYINNHMQILLIVSMQQNQVFLRRGPHGLIELL